MYDKVTDGSQICAQKEEPKHFRVASEVSNMLMNEFDAKEQAEFVRILINNLRGFHTVKKEEAESVLKRITSDLDEINTL